MSNNLGLVSIMDLEEGDQFRFFLSKDFGLENTISEVVRFENRHNEDVPICKDVARFWTDRQEWILHSSSLLNESDWNPCAMVQFGRLVDGAWIPGTKE